MDTPLITELVDFNFSIYPTAHLVPRHRHHFHQLDIALGSKTMIHVEGQAPLSMEVGDACLIPPLVSHGYEMGKGYRQGSFKFHLAPCYWPTFGNQFRRFSPSANLRQAIKNAGNRYLNQSPLTHQQSFAVAMLCLVECAAQISPEDTDPETDDLGTLRAQLWPLLERIELHPNAVWTVPKMAAGCYLSPDHFSRCFHQIVGQTPHSYLLEVRMRAAAVSLLAVPPIQIKAIAAETGYATIYSFCRAFKQVFGVSPTAYRKTPRDM